MSLINDFKHLRLSLKYIMSSTNDFGDEPIGKGGFGKVYKGRVALEEGHSMVAFKRLDRVYGQGDTEFWKEIMMLSEYKHENLISLQNFCNDNAERILVYEYASRGSLDHYLGDASLTWIKRLKICLGAARGVNYLHNPMKPFNSVIHRDIKSANILLDENWTAKVSDFGLSKFGPGNDPHSYLVSNVVGTHGYCDPVYMETGVLSKESDVYSFGVVLFEVMCGRLCVEYNDDDKFMHILVHMWKHEYDEKRLDDIIFHLLKGKVDRDSLMTFSAIARKCLNRERKERPTMTEVMEELEIALEQQETHEMAEDQNNLDMQLMIYLDTYWENKLPKDYANLIKLSDDSIQWTTKENLYDVLREGFLIDNHGKWLSASKNMKKRLMIPARAFLQKEEWIWKSLPESRFEEVAESLNTQTFSISFETQSELLLRRRSYSCHLIYKLPLEHTFLDVPLLIHDKDSATPSGTTRFVKLDTCHTQVTQPGLLRRHPKLRRDGWMEVYLWEVHDIS
ncbi:Helicase, C-terminal [Artemisia annua]|uniref:Helicase, C-terminal n=1 Tax=Artemisia annua TaxID=35608 RepID=A0A2U1P329_ARTAN|nr:Helicase, C-terminal [Artemisia annua]